MAIMKRAKCEEVLQTRTSSLRKLVFWFSGFTVRACLRCPAPALQWCWGTASWGRRAAWQQTGTWATGGGSWWGGWTATEPTCPWWQPGCAGSCPVTGRWGRPSVQSAEREGDRVNSAPLHWKWESNHADTPTSWLYWAMMVCTAPMLVASIMSVTACPFLIFTTPWNTMGLL